MKHALCSLSVPANLSSARRPLTRFLLISAAITAALFLSAASIQAAAVLTIDPAPVTWNTVGLDSNNQTVGPQDYPVGIRVLNTGTTDSGPVSAAFQFTSANANINLLDQASVTTTTIPANDYIDFYFTVRLNRTAAVFDTSRAYQITVTGGDIPGSLIKTDTLFAERLVSQQSNDVLDLVGPDTISAGETRTFILTAMTQNSGRDQVEQFVNFPNRQFQILDIKTNYSYPAPGVDIDRFYADACGWDRTDSTPGNDTCDGPAAFYGAQVGDEITVIYTVYIKETPTEPIHLTTLILDVGGNSFHYNTDFGLNVLTINPPADLSIVKTAADNPVEAGDPVEYLITVINPAGNPEAENVIVKDFLPAGLPFVSANPAPTSVGNPLIWNVGTVPTSSSLTFSVIVNSNCNNTGEFTNTATVESTTSDTNTANNTSSQTVTVHDTTPPSITCPANIVQLATAGQCSRSVTYSALSVNDNCATTPVTVTFAPPSGSTFPVGTTLVTATAQDAAGNTAQCTFNVTILDNEPPAFVCPGPLDFVADADLCAAADVSITTPTVTDNCTTIPVTVTATRSDAAAINAPYPVGKTTITWTATDAAGKTAICTQDVFVRDKTAPELSCAANINTVAMASLCESGPLQFTVSATDNCSTTPVNIISFPPSGSSFPVGVSTVTTTATDSAGNIAVCSFTVTVADNEPPQLTCPATIDVSADTDACEATGVTIVPPTGTDNCTTAPVQISGVRSDNKPLSDPYPTGTTTITWTATDAAGKTQSCNQLVTVRDATSPAIQCVPDQTVVAVNDECESDPVFFEVTATDNCSTGAVTVVSFPASGSIFPVGTTDVLSTATDAAGNISTCTFSVTVLDTQPPDLVCPAPIDLEANAETCEKANVTVVPPAANDNCTTQPVAVSGVRSDAKALNDPYPVGVTIIVWTATASNQQISTCSQTVTIRDKSAPSITCPANITSSVVAGSCQSPAVFYSATATDNCTSTPVDVTFDIPSGSVFNLGETTVIATATDSAGNSASCSFKVIVEDNEDPTITCPLPINVQASALNCQAAEVDVPEPTTSDNCSTSTITPQRSDNLNLSDPYPLGETTIIWTVTDASDNIATCSQTINVLDVTAPGINCPVLLPQPVEAGLCGATVFFDVETSDACGNSSITLSYSHNPGSFFPVGTTQVTVTAEDEAGNQNTCSFDVVVVDNELPTIECPLDIITCMQDIVLSAPLTNDNCATETLETTRSDNLPLTADYPPGITTVYHTVTDIHGNSRTCEQLVMVSEDVLPHIMCPGNVTVNAIGNTCESGPVQYPEPVIMDNCSDDISHLTVTYDPVEDSIFPVGETTVTITVTDPMDNSTSCSFLVIVKDVAGPIIDCPDDLEVNNTPGICGASSVTYSATANDPCSGLVSITFDPPSGSAFNVGVTSVTVTATDNAGNSSECEFTVTVNDTENPDITCPATIDIQADVNDCQAAQVDLNTPVTSDNCSTQTVVPSRSDGKNITEPYPVGITLVTWTVTDASGNSEQCVQQVIVRDSTNPDITCPANITTNTLGQECLSAPITYDAVAASDNCTTDPQGLQVSFDPPSGTRFPVGDNTVIVTVTDAADNQTTCSFIVTVEDRTIPSITCPVDIEQNATAGLCSANVTYAASGADSCSGPVTVTFNPPSGSSFTVGEHIVTATATDTAGNDAQCTFSVTITDAEDPTIGCPNDIDVFADAGKCEVATVNLGEPTVSDNCSQTTITAIRSDGKLLTEPYPVGITIVTWTVTDETGNTAQCQQRVIVRDNTDPIILSCVGNIEVDAVFGSCESGPVFFDLPQVTDNCTTGPENLTVTFNPASGSTFDVGVTSVTATVTDPAGNTATCEFTVTVKDVTPPVIICNDNININSTPGQCGNAAVEFTLSATDGCSPLKQLFSVPASGSAFDIGVTSVTVTAIDQADNISTCSFTVTVNDAEPPILECPAAQIITTTPGECEAQNVQFSADALDNCEGPVTVEFAPPSGTNFGVGTHTVQVTARDAANNETTCSFTLTVEDREAPRIQCQDNIVTATVPCDLEAIVAVTPPEVLDPCGVATIDPVRSDGRPITDRFPIGDTTITWTVTDSNNNQTSCTQLVHVNESDCAPVCDGPDLVVMAKMLPSYKCSSKPTCKVKGWYVVTNVGTQTSGETNVCFYLSDDEVFDAGDFKFKQIKKKYRVKSLAPGQMVGIDLKGKAPKGVSVADKYIIAVVDCPDVVDECREDNNEAADHPMPKMKMK